MKNFGHYIFVVLKGAAMGAADVVPGVSGGTIAFITGIYEELINSIKGFDLKALKLLFTGKFRQFSRKVNGPFLISLLLGILLSILSLARLMTWLLHNRPIATWAFFFGLIIASSLLVGRQVTRWNFSAILSLVIGAAVGYTITALSPTTTPETWWFIMLSGAVAVCAMILPGISGSFILLLLGKYRFIMEAVGRLDIPVLLLFAVGAVIGIISFSHLLSWVFKKFHNVAVAVLTGFMAGSLNKIWPWKSPVTEGNILPSAYGEMTGNSHLGEAVLWCAAGLLLIWVIDYVSRRLARGRGDA